MVFLYDCSNVLGPGQIFRGVHAQEHEVVDTLHHRPINEDRFVNLQPSSSKVNTQLLANIESKVVVWALLNYMIDFSPTPKIHHYP